MKIRTFVVEITVDEKNIRNKYPNYEINYDTSNEFIDSLMFNFENDTDVNIDCLKKFGYRKRVVKEIT